MSEGDVEGEIGEGVRDIVRLRRKGAIELQRDFMPLLEFAGDGGFAIAIGLSVQGCMKAEGKDEDRDDFYDWMGVG